MGSEGDTDINNIFILTQGIVLQRYRRMLACEGEDDHVGTSAIALRSCGSTATNPRFANKAGSLPAHSRGDQ
jgi:hypothetical protein